MNRKIKICLILGHRYGPDILSGIVNSPEYIEGTLEISKAFCVHPSVADITGGYDFSTKILNQARIPHSYFHDINQDWVLNELTELSPRFIIVAGLRQILPPSILGIPRLRAGGHQYYSKGHGCIGFHPSKLPYGPGMSPVQHAVLEESNEISLSSFMIVKDEWDAGPIVLQSSKPMGHTSFDAGEAHKEVCGLAREMACELAEQLASGHLNYEPQNLNGREFRPALRTIDRYIDFNKSVYEVEKRIRAFSPPYRGAYFMYENSTVYVWKAHGKIVNSQQTLMPGEIMVNEETVSVGCVDGLVELVTYSFQQSEPQFVSGNFVHNVET